ncbi:MAG: DUF4080 domain-containing protein [Kiritimatiellae bacterium]|nr:DUF4080 domain-containing protein [Kiritimatiellia bacterium]
MKVLLVAINCSFSHASLAIPYLRAACSAYAPHLPLPRSRSFVNRQSAAEIAAALAREEPAVVGFSCYIFNIARVAAVTARLRERSPRTRIIYGGPEMADGGGEWLARPDGPDYVVRGEGERAFPALLERLAAGEGVPAADGIPGVWWRHGGQVMAGKTAAPIDPLDTVPSPFQLGLFEADKPFVQFEASRGCPFRCDFCLSGEPAGLREFSLARVLADLDRIALAGVGAVRFIDRSFNSRVPRAVAILAFMQERHPAIRIHLELEPSLLRAETLLRKLDRPELHLEIGVQSLNPTALRAVHRRPLDAAAFAAIEWLCRESKACVHLDLIAGLPHARLSDLYTDVGTLSAMEPDEIQVETLKVLRGTALRRTTAKHGIRFDPRAPYAVEATADMTPAELREAHVLARLVDLFYNDQHLGPVLRGICGGLPDPYAAWPLLAAWWRARGLPHFGIAKQARFESLFDFIHELGARLGAETELRLKELWTFWRLHFGRLNPGSRRHGGRFVEGGKLPATKRRLQAYTKAAGPKLDAGHWCVWEFRHAPIARRASTAPFLGLWLRADPRHPSLTTHFEDLTAGQKANI